MSNYLLSYRKGDDFLRYEESFRFAACFDTGSQSTTSLTYTSYNASANSQFLNCPTQAVATPLVVEFRTEKVSAILALLSLELESSAATPGGSVDAALFLDDTELRSIPSSNNTSGKTMFTCRELSQGLHTLELRFKTNNGAVTATIGNPRLSVWCQDLIKV